MAVEVTREEVDRAIILAGNPILKAKSVGEIQIRASQANLRTPQATCWGAHQAETRRRTPRATNARSANPSL
jgi:hypothetical protein